jgi:WhiB family transcriptional regulator, redox-sensing transcriptional regulator
MAVSGAAPAARHQGPGEVSDRALLRALQSGRARCAGSGLDPDEWFPVSPNARVARIQATRAIALCAACQVRAECLEYAMRNWTDGAEEGVWGGFVAAERRVIRRRWLLGVSVAELLDRPPGDRPPVGQPPARAGAAAGGAAAAKPAACGMR